MIYRFNEEELIMKKTYLVKEGLNHEAKEFDDMWEAADYATTHDYGVCIMEDGEVVDYVSEFDCTVMLGMW